ncbi:hypothetical protein HDA45_000605 [Amycolatopsis umgeniensis]|uniref:HEPN/Toprim N-terminal domain-containing protein n=2 Tax=Amycolatopsis umgeniensis TaxID=336628 RepID=A0A841AWL9_9PSEU|nr:hypothetical protein [Amycolatopsis umgeniensis]
MFVTYQQEKSWFRPRAIFREQDRVPVGRGHPDHASHEESDEVSTSEEMAFENFVSCLELIGFNLARVWRECNSVAQNWGEARDDDARCPEWLSFEEFVEFIGHTRLTVSMALR